ncbi:Succinate dehydrogenase flavin-adding protein, antitoxin of CptAB toxin-antitoxin [hydrothermal vent metagenome]|uniref:Succinate dehydrogenase flavin-adding protein, antitoxin of CptAB toxin-antitoxin n=1 Tax=hydrothermal vent metagenome TaxID=652676 RepID=A0A3B0YJK4_9ZZZZ
MIASPKEQDKIHRVYWRCRRGMLELDILLNNFLSKDYIKLAENDKNAFNRLLDYPDNVLLELLLGRTISSDQEIQGVIQKIRTLTTH